MKLSSVEELELLSVIVFVDAIAPLPILSAEFTYIGIASGVELLGFIGTTVLFAVLIAVRFPIFARIATPNPFSIINFIVLNMSKMVVSGPTVIVWLPK